MHEHATRFAPFTAAELAARWRANRQLLADDHRHARAELRGRPAHLKLELTNYCNLACPMCPHPQMQREVGYMRPELFRRIIDQAAPELEFAYLHHLGESLFHGHLGELIRYGRSRGAGMGLSTNATFLDGKRGRALLENGLDFLVISLDGATAQSYEVMRPGGDFASTAANVHEFFALRRALPNHTQVVVQLIATDANRHEVRRFATEWSAEGAQVMVKEARDWAGQVSLIPLGVRTHPPVARTLCKMPWTELTVLWDGAVVPCANHYERDNLLGDLSRQTLDEIWNGPELLRLRAAHLDDALAEVRVCATCPRLPLDHADFVAVDQLAQRRRNYRSENLTPRPGLS